MSLKAGRVGVAPDQVDEFGKIKSEATSGYTKQEADAKFETKTAAAEALAEKQPISLEVPIEMLSGTKLTVETALQGLNEELTKLVTVQESEVTNIRTGAEVTVDLGNHLIRSGNVVTLLLSLSKVTIENAWSDGIFYIPEGFRPTYKYQTLCVFGPTDLRLQISPDTGKVITDRTVSNASIFIQCSWICA